MRNAELEEVLKGLVDTGVAVVPLQHLRYSRVRMALRGHEKELMESVRINGARRTALELTKAGLKISKDTIRKLCKEIEEEGRIYLPPHLSRELDAPQGDNPDFFGGVSYDGHNEEGVGRGSINNAPVKKEDGGSISESGEKDAGGSFGCELDSHKRLSDVGSEKMTPERQREIIARKLKEQRGEL